MLDGFARIGPKLSPSLRDVVAFGKAIEALTKGEAASADATVTVLPLLAIPKPGDSPPGPHDFVDGEQSFAEHLQHQFSRLGGVR